MKIKNSQYLANQIPSSLQHRLLELPEGSSFEISYEGSQSLETFRNRIYSFLHHEGIKEAFRISRRGSSLIYLRLMPLKAKPKLNLHKIEDQALQLFSEPTVHTLVSKLYQALTTKSITQEEFFPIIEEWQRLKNEA